MLLLTVVEMGVLSLGLSPPPLCGQWDWMQDTRRRKQAESEGAYKEERVTHTGNPVYV